MSRRALLVVFVVLVAGCASLPVDDTASPDSPTVSDSAPTRGSALSTLDPDNPWGSRTLTVALSTAPDDDRAYAPLVREALDYWEANAERYAGYPVDYVLDPDASTPDLEIRFVSAVTHCEGLTDAAGCAPYITAPGQVDRPEQVEVVTGLSNESTVLVVKHELGHTLGLDHDDDPESIMSARELLTTLPKPNATERDLPWEDPTLSVFVDDSTVPVGERDAVRRQIQHALDYYEDGADGFVPENVTFVRTENRTAADVVISFPSIAPCDGITGSCGSRGGVDEDGDGALEYYTRLEITVTGVDTDAVGWHVGYWLGYGFGFDDAIDWPLAFRDASREDRRGDWWSNDSSGRAGVAVADGGGSLALRSGDGG